MKRRPLARAASLMKSERPAFHRVGRLHRHCALAISVEDAHLIAVFDKVHRKGVSLISETLPLARRGGWLNRVCTVGSLLRFGRTRRQESYSAAICSPLTPLAMRSPTVLSMFRQYSIARPSTGSFTPSLRWPATLETSRSRAALSMTLRTSVPA